MKTILHSIPVKISLVILVVESILLGLMGTYYINRFSGEIDRSIKEKVYLPSTLMSQRALNFTTVMDFKALAELVNEEIVDAFICKKDGSVYYSHDAGRIGNDFHSFLDVHEPLSVTAGEQEKQLVYFTGGDGSEYISTLSPLWASDNLIGYLYLKINADQIAARKKGMVVLFLLGSLITIILTTILEAIFVQRMLLPRINDTCEVLKRVSNGDLTARVSSTHSDDEIDTIRQHLDKMITTVERNTRSLELLNEAGKSFVDTESRETILEICSDAIALLLNLSPEPACFLNQGEKAKDSSCSCLDSLSSQDRARIDNQELVIINPGDELSSLNMIDNPKGRLYLSLREDEGCQILLGFYSHDKKIDLQADDKESLRSILRMANNAIRRLLSWKKIKEAEEKYRDLFSSAVEGIFSYDLNGGLEVANPALVEMMGYETLESMLAECSRDNVTLFGNREELAQLCEHINERDKVRDIEIRPFRRDGSIFRASLTAYAKRDANGKMIAIEGRILSIEERKLREDAEREHQAAKAANQAKSEMLLTLEDKNQQLEQTLTELNEAQLKMMQSERMAAIGMTAGGVAHDLNNILAGVVSYPELMLLRLPEDSDLRKPLKAILSSGKRAAAVVADLLTLTRGTAHNKIPMVLNTLVIDYLESAEYEYLGENHPNIQVRTELAPDLLPILCAPVYIHKMIMNLVTNSVEAMNNNGEVVIITENTTVPPDSDTFPALAGGSYVILKIIDNGSGIVNADLEHIFDPFYTKKVMGRSGTGLGLTIVQNAVIEHNGAISVDSSEQGTTFTIHLPTEAAAEITADVGDSKSDAPLPQNCGGSLLVVDDDAVLRDIANQLLQELGYTVHLTKSGDEAVAFCKEQEVDLVLLDMLMPPGMNGRQTFEAIKAIRPQQKALIVSGFSEDREVRRAIEIGCCGFLKKPYTMKQLAEIVHETLNG